MPVYTCEKCGETFQQKSHFDNHNARKKPCDKKRDLQQIIQAVVQTTKNELLVHLEQTIKPVTMTERIVSKEQRVKFFEDLHNLLWNDVGLSPAKALEHMTFFFAFRMIEPQFDKINELEMDVSKKLPEVCKWSNVVALTHDESIFKAVQDATKGFRMNSITKQYFSMHEIKRAEDVRRIMKLIDRLDVKTLQETDTLGDIFEYMLDRGMSTMADQGQYFTDRVICNLAFKLAHIIHPETRRADGTLCRFADLFCGTGGFVGAYVKGISTLAKNKGEVIDWMNESKHIYAVDKDLASVRLTLLNLLIQTGTPFSEKNIIERNSFQQNIIIGKTLEIAPFMGETFDFEFMNPPYGGDKSKGKEYKFAYAKGKGAEKKYLVNSEIQSIGIEDDDKVSAGVQLSMATLSADGGVCCIVLPQGFFFGASKKCVELRKKIAEEYKIHYVVDIASGAFANTGTKTSMMVFQKGVGATEKVSFINLDEKLLVEATLTDLRAKHYSLNYKQYLPQSAVEVEGFEMVKLGDICHTKNGFAIKSENMTKNTSDYPVIKVKNLNDGVGRLIDDNDRINIKLKDEFIVKKGDVLIVMVGNTAGKMAVWEDKDAYLNQNVHKIHFKEKAVPRYVYYILNSPALMEQILPLSSGTAQPFISPSSLYEIQIPLPSLERQAEIVEAIDGWASLAQQEEVALKILEKQMMFQVREMGRGKERVKLGDMLKDVKYPKHPTEYGKESGNYRFHTGAESTKLYTNAPDIDDLVIIVNRTNGSGKCHIFIDSKCSVATQTITFASKIDITTAYLYYYFKSDISVLEAGYQGACHKNLTSQYINDLEIPLPPFTEQQTLQSDFDEIRHKHAKIAEYKAKAQAAIQRLIPGAVKKEEIIIEEIEEVEVEPLSPPPSTTLSIIPPTKPDYKAMSRAQLIEECKKNNLKGVSTKKKEDLIKMLEAL